MRTMLLLGALALAVAGPAGAGEPHRWTLSAEGGGSRIHDDDQSAAGALRLQRDLDAGGRVRVQLGVAIATYGALDLGLELHPWPQSRVSPFLGAGGGLMWEDEYQGRPFFRGTLGVEVKMSPRAVLRLAGQAGTHDDQPGPHMATIGIGFRF